MSATLDTLQFGLCRDMLAVVDVVAQFDVSRLPATWLEATRRLGALTLTGEGSSRIFPSKQAMRIANQRALSIVVHSVGGCEAALYAPMLKTTAVLGISNSGRTVKRKRKKKKKKNSSFLFNFFFFF
jgi:glucosamine--fructose-6-phosphate aminotransferase (isomerizing)